MPGTDKYYRVRPTQYQSQFVPMPLDFMAKQIAGKQAGYDKQDLLQNKDLGEAYFEALEGGDTKFRDKKIKEFQNFIDESAGQDLGSSQYQKKYTKFIRDWKADKGIQSVKAAYAKDLAHEEEKKKRMDQDSYDPAWDYNYQRRRAEYTKEGGLGYAGDIQLGEATINRDADIWGTQTKYFKELKESGSDALKYLSDPTGNIAYKNGWKGVSNERVREQFDATFNDYMNTNAYRQEGAQFDMTHEMSDYDIAALSPEKRKEYEEAKHNHIANQFLEAGKTYVRGTATTNIDAALNKQRGEQIERDKNITVDPSASRVLNQEESKSSHLADLALEIQDMRANGVPENDVILRNKIDDFNQRKRDIGNEITNQENATYKFFNKVAGWLGQEEVINYNDPNSTDKNMSVISDKMLSEYDMSEEDVTILENTLTSLLGDEGLKNTLFGLESKEEQIRKNIDEKAEEWGVDASEGSMGDIFAISPMWEWWTGDEANANAQTDIILNKLEENGFDMSLFEDDSDDWKAADNARRKLMNHIGNIKDVLTSENKLDYEVNNRIKSKEDDPVAIYTAYQGIGVPNMNLIDENGTEWLNINPKATQELIDGLIDGETQVFNLSNGEQVDANFIADDGTTYSLDELENGRIETIFNSDFKGKGKGFVIVGDVKIRNAQGEEIRTERIKKFVTTQDNNLFEMVNEQVNMNINNAKIKSPNSLYAIAGTNYQYQATDSKVVEEVASIGEKNTKLTSIEGIPVFRLNNGKVMKTSDFFDVSARRSGNVYKITVSEKNGSNVKFETASSPKEAVEKIRYILHPETEPEYYSTLFKMLNQ